MSSLMRMRVINVYTVIFINASKVIIVKMLNYFIMFRCILLYKVYCIFHYCIKILYKHFLRNEK